MKVQDILIIFLIITCIILSFHNIYLTREINIMTDEFHLIKKSTLILEEKINLFVRNNELILNEKISNNTHINSNNNFFGKYKNLIIILSIISLSVGLGYGSYMLIISFIKIPSLDSLIRVLEILILNISAKLGFNKDYIFEFIDSTGKEYIFKLSNNSSGLYIKLSEDNIIEIGEYLSQIASSNISNEIINTTPEILDIIMRGIA